MESIDIRHFREGLRQLQRNLGWLLKNDAACCGITVAQCHALLEIGKNDDITLVELASALGLDTSTLSRTIDGMVEAGIVERKAKPEDRRYLKIVTTRRGREILDEINCTFDTFYRKVFNSIPMEKHAQIIESINLLATTLADNNNTCCRKELT